MAFSLSFPGVPQVPNTVTNGQSLSYGTPSAGGTFTGFISGLPGSLDMGKTYVAPSTGATAEHLGNSQPVTQGNAPQSTILGLDMGTILQGAGQIASAVAGGNPTIPATNAGYQTPPSATGSVASKFPHALLIGGALIGAYLVMRGH